MKQQIRVLYIGMTSSIGGIESFIINVFRKVDKSKVKIDFMKFEDKICFEDEIEDNGSDIFKLASRKDNPLKFYYSLILFFKSHPEYTVVHFHLNTCSCIAPAVIAKLYGRKVIAHSHNQWKGDRKIVAILHSINKKILPLFIDKRLACSEVASKWIFGNQSYKFINNGIDVSKYIYNPQMREKVRNSLGVREKIVIGHVGRLTYQKNHDFLIDIFNEIFKKNNNTILILVGSGELELQLKKKVSDLKLENAVLFLGVRSDISEILQAMDGFLFPSFFEGLPITLIEAQSAGLPCIVSDVITKEVDIYNTMCFINLEQTAKIWADKVLEQVVGYKRIESIEKIREAGYDIEKTTKELEKIYSMI